jgi:hypothetical protein
VNVQPGRNAFGDADLHVAGGCLEAKPAALRAADLLVAGGRLDADVGVRLLDRDVTGAGGDVDPVMGLAHLHVAGAGADRGHVGHLPHQDVARAGGELGGPATLTQLDVPGAGGDVDAAAHEVQLHVAGAALDLGRGEAAGGLQVAGVHAYVDGGVVRNADDHVHRGRTAEERGRAARRLHDDVVAALFHDGLLDELVGAFAVAGLQQHGRRGGVGGLDGHVAGVDLDPQPYGGGGVELVHGSCFRVC